MIGPYVSICRLFSYVVLLECLYHCLDTYLTYFVAKKM